MIQANMTQPTPPNGENAVFVGIWFTNACNLNCTYCYIKQKSNLTISYEKALEVLGAELSKEGGLMDILFMGAETLTHFEEMKKIVEGISAQQWKRRYHFTITTNGTLLTEEMKVWFTAHRDTVTMGLSYDGNDDAQDCNRSESSLRIDKDYFRNTWPIQKWKMTISADTAPDTDRNVIALHELGIPFSANVAYEDSAWPEDKILQYEYALFRLADYYIAHPEIKPCSLLSLLEDVLEAPLAVKQKRFCGAGESMCFFDMEGTAYPCHMLSPLVMPKEQALAGMYFSADADFEDPRCRSCPVKHTCYTCLGTNYLYRGDVRKRDPLHCRLYQAEIRATAHMWIGKLRAKDAYTETEKKMIKTVRKLMEAFRAGTIGMRDM